MPHDARGELARMSRLYAALSHVNQAIVRMPPRAELFRRVCDVLVDEGGFGMAWIGQHEASTRELVPVAVAGDPSGYLQTIRVYTDERAEGRGPSGHAFRSGAPYVCNDILADAATRPWRDELERRGLRASAAFPIREGGLVSAILSVYSHHAGFFEEAELTLLREASDDLAFALDHLAVREDRERAEIAAEQEARFAIESVEAMPGVFYLYDMAGRFLRWNRNFEHVSGYSGDEIAGMHPLDFFADDEKSLLERRIAEVFEHGESQVEASLLSKNGACTPHFFTGKRIQFEDRTCLVGVGVDISERKQAEDALRRMEHRYRSTLDNILEGCQLIDYDFRYLYLNQAAATQNRRPNAELLGVRMMDAWPGIDATHVFGIMARSMDQRVGLHEETEFTFPDGSTGWFDVRVQPVPEGIFVLSIDISERKLAELALRELNESLEKKIEERTRELEVARTRAESADRLKSAFLATMSHELRTPLNSILGFTGIILQKLAGPLTDEQSKQLGMVQTSARHLLELINDVLDISKIEAGQLEVRLSNFDLLASVERAVSLVRPFAQKKGLHMDLELPRAMQPVESDRRRVEQILLNLLNNAVKFTDRGRVSLAIDIVDAAGDPRLNARCEGESFVRIRVSDTGIGIRESDLEKLYQPFRQIVTGLERPHDGTGLGLAICRRLVELLGGTIRTESTWGVGSTFTVSLPIRARGGT